MYIGKSLSLALVLASTGAMAAQSAKPSDAQKIAAFYDKQDAVMLSNNAGRLTKFFRENLTPDFVLIEMPDSTGNRHQTNLADAIDEWSMFVDEGKYTKYTHTVDHIAIGKGSAVVRITVSVVCRLKGSDAHVIKSKSSVEDEWVKVGKTWKMKSSKSLGDNQSVDGKPGGMRTITRIPTGGGHR